MALYIVRQAECPAQLVRPEVRELFGESGARIPSKPPVYLPERVAKG